MCDEDLCARDTRSCHNPGRWDDGEKPFCPLALFSSGHLPLGEGFCSLLLPLSQLLSMISFFCPISRSLTFSLSVVQARVVTLCWVQAFLSCGFIRNHVKKVLPVFCHHVAGTGLVACGSTLHERLEDQEMDLVDGKRGAILAWLAGCSRGASL